MFITGGNYFEQDAFQALGMIQEVRRNGDVRLRTTRAVPYVSMERFLRAKRAHRGWASTPPI